VNASAARVSTQRAIGVHLTPFAPDVEHDDVASPRRWRDFWNKDPVLVVRAILRRIARAPQSVAAVEAAGGEIDLLSDPPAHMVPYLSTGADPVVIAVIWDGMSLDQVREILSNLHAAGWAPPEAFEYAA